MEEITRKVYRTVDGKEFLDRDEAKQHEDHIKGTKFYMIRARPELTERGTLQDEYYISVRPYHDMGHDLMVEDYLYRRYGSRAAYVQGVARTLRWVYYRVDWEKIPEIAEIKEINEENIHKVTRD